MLLNMMMEQLVVVYSYLCFKKSKEFMIEKSLDYNDIR